MDNTTSLEQLLRASVALLAAARTVDEAQTTINHQQLEIDILRAHVQVLEAANARLRKEHGL
jgi:hypothetical protein